MEGNKELCANLINGDMKSLIESTIEKNFGVKTNIIAKVYPRYVDIIDDNNDVQTKMRGNKLLRHIFENASFGGTAWFEEESNIIHISLRINYSHPNGGSNGRELGRILVYTTKNKAKYLQI
jgi:hypothetical protein